jgi:hypothetical protein
MVELPGITVCIPTIAPRRHLLERALFSVLTSIAHVRTTCTYIVVEDTGKQGAAATRQDALKQARTKWVAFLDDDDEMDFRHLKVLWETALEWQADYVWSRFRIGYPDGTRMPGPAPLGQGTFEQWNDEQPAQTTVTTFVRRELALDVGGFLQQPLSAEDTIDGQRAGEDWLFTLACREAGATFRHAPEVTWTWHHHQSNTSGLPSRW